MEGEQPQLGDETDHHGLLATYPSPGMILQVGDSICVHLLSHHPEYQCDVRYPFLATASESVCVCFLFLGCWITKWVFPKIGVPQNGWFIMENPIKMDDLGIPLFLDTPKCVSNFLRWQKIPKIPDISKQVSFGKHLHPGS